MEFDNKDYIDYLDYLTFQEEYNNNSEFKESIDNMTKSYKLDSVSSSSSSITFDDGTTVNLLSEQEENNEPETQTVIVYDTTDYSDHLNGILQNTYFICYFCFAFFIFGALILVIKFLKSFF